LIGENVPTADVSGETPVFFPAGQDTLFGVLARPAEPTGTAVIALPDAGGPASINRNRWWVRLSRRLAAHGCHVLRFDYHGMGESTGVVRRFRLDEPFVDDLLGAVRCSTDHDVERFILVGSCFGARTALSAAGEIPRLDGVVLISVGLRDLEKGEAAATRRVHEWRMKDYAVRGFHPRVLRGLFSQRRRRGYALLLKMKLRAATASLRKRLGLAGHEDPAWLATVSTNFLAPLEALVRRGVPILFLYGTDDDFYGEFCRAATGELGRTLARGGDRVEVATVPGRVHNFVSVEGQDAALDLVFEWIGRRQGVSEVGVGS
jgi:pimeloyl-ACP methyl ester carboxylesterase